MQLHAIVCCPEAATKPARECPGGSFQHVVVFKREHRFDQIIRIADDFDDALQPADEVTAPSALFVARRDHLNQRFTTLGDEYWFTSACNLAHHPQAFGFELADCHLLSARSHRSTSRALFLSHESRHDMVT